VLQVGPKIWWPSELAKTDGGAAPREEELVSAEAGA
jgi:hypothetical protein